MQEVTFGSLCSGIEAASAAWHPLGMRTTWLSEIEPFPCAVLAHQYPSTANIGDMYNLRPALECGLIEVPTVLIGGTPCQSFSVAGLRKGLEDDRGQLTLEFVRIANALDEKRPKNEAVIVWENVPGVLSSKDNAFGCFLGALCGESSELKPAGSKWSHAGVVYGPQRTVAWRILDAQYFGVAQRRRRVFVVASARAGFDPQSVLFESEGLRRDIAPSREAGESAPTYARSGFGVSDKRKQIVGTLCASDQKGVSNQLLGDGKIVYPIQNATRGKHQNGLGLGADTSPMYTLDTASQHGVCYGFQTRIARNGRGDMGDLVHALSAQSGQTGKGDSAPCVAFAQNSRNELRLEGGDGQRTGALSTGGGKPGQGLPTVLANGLVRRLTPVECERLQGFPDGYTAIPWRGKPASECPDGPRYKALGNSMAVPVIAWIGHRIKTELLK